MFYCGIDIAKNKHYACIVDSNGKEFVSAFEFNNSREGFNLFLSKLKDIDLSNTLFGMESTGHYGENLISFLNSKGFKIGIINPIQTNALRKMNIRKTKTDKVDTYLIAKCLILNNYSLLTNKDIKMIELKSITRFRDQLVKDRTKMKLRLVSAIDQLFPELNSFFKGNLHLNASYKLLEKYSSPDEIKKARTNTLANLLCIASRGRYSIRETNILKDLAKSSIGVNNPSLSIQIKLLLKQINLLSEQILEVDLKTKSIMDELDSVILTIPGIGYTLGAIILSEISDINRFSEPCKLLAFAGLDPSVIQSGEFNALSTKISKRGSSALRYALVKASSLIIHYNNTFNTYYTQKLSTGKQYNVVLGHVSHKLVRIIFHLLKNNIKFNLE
jgi:transposase